MVPRAVIPGHYGAIRFQTSVINLMEGGMVSPARYPLKLRTKTLSWH